jgi:hypothetical protein
VKIKINTRCDHLITSSNIPHERLGTVNCSIIEHSNAAGSISLNSMPQSSPFFHLPLEIRIIIYEFVIGEHDLHVHHPSEPCKLPAKGPNCSPSGFSRKILGKTRDATQKLLTFRNKPSPLAIAATCDKFYHEAVGVWYGNVRFFFHSMTCTRMFLEEIGDSNRDSIRHVGYSALWGAPVEQDKEIFDMICSFTSLKTLKVEDVGNVMYPHGRNYSEYLTEVEMLLSIWNDEAQNRLRLCERLERVVITTPKVHRGRLYRWKYTLGEDRECTELELNRCTGEIKTTTSTVEYDNNDPRLGKKSTEVCLRDGHACSVDHSSLRMWLRNLPRQRP